MIVSAGTVWNRTASKRRGMASSSPCGAGYLALAETEPGVQVLDARGTPEQVHATIRELLETCFPETFQ